MRKTAKMPSFFFIIIQLVCHRYTFPTFYRTNLIGMTILGILYKQSPITAFILAEISLNR